MENRLLWERHTADPSPENLNDLTKAYLPLVKNVYRRKFSRWRRSKEELLQEGSQALVKAIQTWPGQGDFMPFGFMVIFRRMFTYVTRKLYNRPDLFGVQLYHFLGIGEENGLHQLLIENDGLRQLEIQDELDHLFSYLPAQAYEVMLEHFGNGKTLRELLDGRRWNSHQGLGEQINRWVGKLREASLRKPAAFQVSNTH